MKYLLTMLLFALPVQAQVLDPDFGGGNVAENPDVENPEEPTDIIQPGSVFCPANPDWVVSCNPVNDWYCWTVCEYPQVLVDVPEVYHWDWTPWREHWKAALATVDGLWLANSTLSAQVADLQAKLEECENSLGKCATE